MNAKTLFLTLPFTAIALPALALDQGHTHSDIHLTPLLSGNTTIIEQAIEAYPEGAPNITAAIIEVPPGIDTGWHIHDVPLFAYILEGEIVVDYGEKGTKTYRQGDSLLEAMNWPHNGINRSDKPVKILAVYIGNEILPNAEAVPAPK